MIEKDSMILAKDRANTLAANGVFLRAVASTPLADLCAHTVPVVPSGVTEDDYTFVEDANNPQHNQQLTDMADFLADAISGYMAFARNVVAPVLGTVIEESRERLAAIAVDPTAGFSLVESTYPPMLDSVEFKEAAKMYANGMDVLPDLSFGYPAYTDAQIREACLTGSNNLDMLINQWFDTLPANALQVVWQSAFQDKLSGAPAAISYEDLFKDPLLTPAYACIVFLLCQRLSQNIDADCGLGLEPARRLFQELKQAAAMGIERALARFDSYRVTGTVVLEYNPIQKQVVVNREQYRVWISEGGKVEVLFGNLVLGTRNVMKSELLASAEKALNAWTWHCTVTQAEADNRYFADVKTIACIVFDDQLENATDEGELQVLAAPGEREKIRSMFRALIGEATSEQFRTDFADVIWRATCKARYYYTQAYVILSEMEYQQKSRNQSVSDAATAATVKILANYIAEMVTTEPEMAPA